MPDTEAGTEQEVSAYMEALVNTLVEWREARRAVIASGDAYDVAAPDDSPEVVRLLDVEQKLLLLIPIEEGRADSQS